MNDFGVTTRWSTGSPGPVNSSTGRAVEFPSSKVERSSAPFTATLTP